MAETRQLLKYKLIEEVGHGGMAVVYRGLDTTLDREVAVKILHSHLAEQEESKQRFQREAQAVAKLRHENIIEIYDYSGIESDDSYIVTEFIHGQTLKEYLSRHPISHPEIAALIIVEVCNALSHAHQAGVIHRDIKPENIMIREDGWVKLTDFGIAQVVDVQRLTVTGQLLGSPAYMAPELVRGGQIDFRADIFSIGTLLYQLATSELPFKGKNPHEVLKRIAEVRYVDPEVANPIVGTQLARIIRKALASDPDDRYQSVDRLQADLMGFLALVNISEPRTELGRYFTSPKSYSQQLQEQIVSVLTDRGKAALSKRQTPRALEFFNRVLCADPNNQEVLAILDQVNRRRRLGRVVAVLGITGLLGVSAYMASSYWPEKVPASTADSGQGDASTTPQDAAAGDTTLPDMAVPDAQRKVVRQPILRRFKVLPLRKLPSRKAVRLVPSPRAVTVQLNKEKPKSYGPDLQQLDLQAGDIIIFRNPGCFEKKVKVTQKHVASGELNVKLKWHPARVRVMVTPNVGKTDVLVGTIVVQPGQEQDVYITTRTGHDEVVIKVSAPGYSTVSRKVKVTASRTITVPITLVKETP
jgi:serine/threonine protein kinase